MSQLRQYRPAKQQKILAPNQWDLIAFVIVLGIIVAFSWAGRQMTAPYQVGEPIAIHLSPNYLPAYAISTVLRMFIALFFSLLFTFTFGTFAAKSKQAEKVIIPFIDIMQSVPVLGVLSISVVAFIRLFPGSLLGPEFAAIFAIFTAQVWNMALSFYQSLRTVPSEVQEAALIFHLTPWQKFWRIEVPHALPGLLWNTMMSMSAAWFFVVASEAISVSNQHITLPGIGSYIAKAIELANYHAIGYAILAMFIVIVIYDQIIFRPFLSWAEKFKTVAQFEEEHESDSWVLDILQRTRLKRYISIIMHRFNHWFINLGIPKPMKRQRFPIPTTIKVAISKTAIMFWNTIIILSISISIYLLAKFILDEVSAPEILEVLFLGAITAFKVAILIVISSLIWVPIGVWLGLRPKIAKMSQPITQFLAAFPANLLFPVVVMGIIRFDLNVDIWTTPLMILGTQWYILFNVIAGTSAIPKELILASQNLGLTGWLWWKRLALPAIFPFYITGAMTAAGGCWNASILADVVSWGTTKLTAVGLGGYITQYTTIGDFPRIALGIGMMCLYVLVINRLVWSKLYNLASERYRIDI